jgi:hypothetical protein
VSRPTPDRADADEVLLTRLVSESGDPEVEPRPEHVAALRARLLDRLGPPRAARPWRTRWLMGSGLAATCLLAVLAWPRPDVKNPVLGPDAGQSAPQVTTRPPDVPSGDAAWLAARRSLDGTQPTTFHWPLQETASLMVSSPLPPDLLD